MASVIYAIVFNGEIVEGFKLPTVKAHMGKLLKADAHKIQALFDGKTVVLKRTTDKSAALKYGSVLKRVGANVRIKVLKPSAPQPSATKQTAAKATSATSKPELAAARAKAARQAAAQAKGTKVAATRTGTRGVPRQSASKNRKNAGFTLAPNVGNLFDAAPEIPVPDLDLSEFSLKKNDGTPLVKPKVYKRAKIDLSKLSVAKNDGSRLFKAAPVVKKVVAPDFGLDVPGALLETLAEVVELLDPDTSGMSLAFPGTDLLNEDEKKGPPPPPPDTSKISLAPE